MYQVIVAFIYNKLGRDVLKTKDFKNDDLIISKSVHDKTSRKAHFKL